MEITRHGDRERRSGSLSRLQLDPLRPAYRRRARLSLADLTVTGLAGLPVRGRPSNLAKGPRGVGRLAPLLALSFR
jgi:hypothetical protein